LTSRPEGVYFPEDKRRYPREIRRMGPGTGKDGMPEIAPRVDKSPSLTFVDGGEAVAEVLAPVVGAGEAQDGQLRCSRMADKHSSAYAALKHPTVAQYLTEKDRILREHGHDAMLAFAKEQQPHDYVREIGGTTKGPVLFTEAELREIIASEVKGARGLKTVAEIRAGWKSKEAMKDWDAPQAVQGTATLAERLMRKLGFGPRFTPGKEREPEREP
jgi:hypothetical protein